MTANVNKYPAFIAFIHVSKAGLNKDAWMNVILSASVGMSSTAFSECLYVDVFVRSFMVHNPFGMCVPYIITFLSYHMYMFVFVKTAQHPALHNCLIDNMDLDASDGNRCTVCASLGKYGMLSSPMCVDDMLAPLGSMTDILLLIFFLLIMGMLRWRYSKK